MVGGANHLANKCASDSPVVKFAGAHHLARSISRICEFLEKTFTKAFLQRVTVALNGIASTLTDENTQQILQQIRNTLSEGGTFNTICEKIKHVLNNIDDDAVKNLFSGVQAILDNTMKSNLIENISRALTSVSSIDGFITVAKDLINPATVLMYGATGAIVGQALLSALELYLTRKQDQHLKDLVLINTKLLYMTIGTLRQQATTTLQLNHIINGLNIKPTVGVNQLTQPAYYSNVNHQVKEELPSKLEKLGLKFVQIIGDGHCFYRAVSLYLNHGKDPLFLRNLVAAHLEANKGKFADFIALSGRRTLEDYIDAIRNSNEWADHVEIEILMRVLDRPILIIDPSNGLRNLEAKKRFKGAPIFVYYRGNHYDGLVVDVDKGVSADTVIEQLTVKNDKPEAIPNMGSEFIYNKEQLSSPDIRALGKSDKIQSHFNEDLKLISISLEEARNILRNTAPLDSQVLQIIKIVQEEAESMLLHLYQEKLNSENIDDVLNRASYPLAWDVVMKYVVYSDRKYFNKPVKPEFNQENLNYELVKRLYKKDKIEKIMQDLVLEFRKEGGDDLYRLLADSWQDSAETFQTIAEKIPSFDDASSFSQELRPIMTRFIKVYQEATAKIARAEKLPLHICEVILLRAYLEFCRQTSKYFFAPYNLGREVLNGGKDALYGIWSLPWAIPRTVLNAVTFPYYCYKGETNVSGAISNTVKAVQAHPTRVVSKFAFDSGVSWGIGRLFSNNSPNPSTGPNNSPPTIPPDVPSSAAVPPPSTPALVPRSIGSTPMQGAVPPISASAPVIPPSAPRFVTRNIGNVPMQNCAVQLPPMATKSVINRVNNITPVSINQPTIMKAGLNAAQLNVINKPGGENNKQNDAANINSNLPEDGIFSERNFNENIEISIENFSLQPLMNKLCELNDFGQLYDMIGECYDNDIKDSGKQLIGASISIKENIPEFMFFNKGEKPKWSVLDVNNAAVHPINCEQPQNVAIGKNKI